MVLDKLKVLVDRFRLVFNDGEVLKIRVVYLNNLLLSGIGAIPENKPITNKVSFNGLFLSHMGEGTVSSGPSEVRDTPGHLKPARFVPSAHGHVRTSNIFVDMAFNGMEVILLFS